MVSLLPDNKMGWLCHTARSIVQQHKCLVVEVFFGYYSRLFSIVSSMELSEAILIYR
jgi:hypothetical protein